MNFLFYASLITVVLYLSSNIFEKGRKYIKKYKSLDEIEDKYDNLRNCRKELLVYLLFFINY